MSIEAHPYINVAGFLTGIITSYQDSVREPYNKVLRKIDNELIDDMTDFVYKIENKLERLIIEKT